MTWTHRPTWLDLHPLPFLLVTDEFRRFESENNRGSTNLFLNFSNIAEYRFVLPSMPEQRRLVSLLLSARRLAADHQRLADAAAQLPDAVMSDFLRSAFGTDRPLRFGAHGNARIDLRKAGDLLRARQGLQIAQAERFKEPASGLFPYLTAQYLFHGGSVEYVPAASTRVICVPQDVLVLRTGMTNGEVFTDLSGVFHNNFFAVDYDSSLLERDFIVAYLRHPNVRHLMKALSGATNIPDLNHGDFYSIPFPLPSRAVQVDLCERYRSARAGAASAQARHAEALELAFSLGQRMLRQS